MDFALTEERQMLADTIGRFVERDYALNDRTASAFGDHGFSEQAWEKFAELGVIGAVFSEDDSGFGGTGFDLAVVFEALGKGLVIEPILDSALLPGRVLTLAGSDPQKAMIEDVIAGAVRLAFAHYEADSHFELGYVTTTATRSNGGFVLSGAKSVVKFAEGADHFVVSARTQGDDVDTDGISLFLVPANAEGITLTGYSNVDGGRAAEVLLVDVPVSSDAMIGDLNAGYGVLETAVAAGILALCGEALGIMERIKEMTIEYLRTRKQFGLALGRFQALQHRMAQVLLEIEQARSAVINLASDLESDRTTREKSVSAAKYSIGRIGALVVEESIQMHGGIGMTWEYGLGHFAKRLTMIDHELGDEDTHLARFMALSKEDA